MASKRVRSMVPALTFGAGSSKVELKPGRRGKIQLTGNGLFSLDELDLVVQRIGEWVRSQRPLPTLPPLPEGRRMEPAGLSDSRGDRFALDAQSLEVLD